MTHLLSLGRMPEDEHAVDVDVEAFDAAVRALEPPATSEEALSLLDVLPLTDASCFALAWSVLTFIETAPDWPVPSALDDSNWWVTFLRERAERGGRL